MSQPQDDLNDPWLIRLALRSARFFSGHAVLVITALVGGLLVVGLTAAGSEVYEAVAAKNGISGIDRPTLDQAIRWRTPLADQLLTWFTNLGGPIGMTIIAGIVTILMVWRWRSPTPLILIVAAVAGSLTFTNVGKAIVGRVRPPLSDAIPPYEYAFSFPSGHTLNSTVIAGMVAYLVARRLRSRVSQALCVLAAAIWAIAMGLSRVLLGHHWLTDVIFAWLIGLAWLALLITAHRIFLIVWGKRPTSAAATGPVAVERPR
jgi:membrane-associated phospholipid phosphatase